MSDDEVMDATESAPPANIMLKIRLSLKGRPIRSFSFSKDIVTIGRDPEADLFLDNPGISRHHLRLERCQGGYCAEDSGSANGTLLNDQPLQQAILENDDVLRVGKFSLWVSYEKDRRESANEAAQIPTTSVGTTVLTTAELERMITKTRACDEESKVARLEHREVPRNGAARPWRLLAVAAVLGALLGSSLTWWLTR